MASSTSVLHHSARAVRGCRSVRLIMLFFGITAMMAGITVLME